jgi:alkylglycerol monooxygenase
MNFIEMLIPVFVLLILTELYVNSSRQKSYYSLQDSIADMSLGIISRLTDLFVLYIMFHIYTAIQDSFSLGSLFSATIFNFGVTSASETKDLVWSLASFGFLFLSLDFMFYWSHRFSHEVNILWASHVTHHSSEEYNLTVALRQSFLRNFIVLCFYLIFALFAVPWQILLLVDASNRFYQFWVHTRFIKRMPNWFEYVFVTPAHHRVHHARNPEYLDKNYAGVFIFWDRMFGTFREETIEPIYGIVKPLKSFSAIDANLHLFQEILRKLQSTSNFSTAIKILFSRPEIVSRMEEKQELKEFELMRKSKASLKITVFQRAISILCFLTLIGLSLFLIKIGKNLELAWVAIFYCALLGGYGLLGNYLNQITQLNSIHSQSSH